MFKLAIFGFIGVMIWGGLFSSFSFTNSEGDFSISIDKEKAISSLSTGMDKVTNTYNDTMGN